MENQERTVMASFAMPQTLFQKVRMVAKKEDLNLSILYRKMVRDWLGRHENANKEKEESNMSL